MRYVTLLNLQGGLLEGTAKQTVIVNIHIHGAGTVFPGTEHFFEFDLPFFRKFIGQG
jgi:hypothetical protein